MDYTSYPENDRELAALCGTWQQLDMLKRRRQEQRDGLQERKSLEDMTRSERLLWYRSNKDLVEQDRAMAGYCSNYRQLEMMRGKGVLSRDQWEDTRSNRLIWYRNGGREVVEKERELAGLCTNWKQFHLLTRGPACRAEMEEEKEDREATRSERLLWYRNGGKEIVEDDLRTASNSENWVQYKLTRDARLHALNLQTAVQTSYSDFKSKESLSDYIFEMRKEAREERDEIRTSCRTRSISDSVTKSAYDYHLQPYAAYEMEAASSMSAQSKQKIDHFEEELRQITESVMTMRTQYMLSASELAMKAYKEDAEAVAASRTSRKTMVVQQGQAVSSVA